MYDHGDIEVREQLADKVAALRDPACYPETTGRIEAIETHMAWVFLTAEHAYKLKKPVQTPLLDYTTAQKRRQACRAEVELNRRLAPWVYLGVVSLVETDGQFVVEGNRAAGDWLVKMKRLPRGEMLDARIEDDDVLSDEIEPVSKRLCEFYHSAEPARFKASQYLRRLSDDIQQKAESLKKPHYALDPVKLREAVDRLYSLLGVCTEPLSVRADRVVDAHGDLRPEHICLVDEPVIIDCLEFSRSLRLLDPVSELSFLALECRRLGAAWIGKRLLAGYVDQSGDEPPSQLVEFYTAYHALIRAAVALWHLDDTTLDDDDKWRRRARWYLDEIDGSGP